MRAGLAQDVVVLLQALVHDRRHVVQVAEGRLGAEFAVGEELADLVFVGQRDRRGVQLPLELAQIDLVRGGQNAHDVPVVGLDDDRLGHVLARLVFDGRQTLRAENRRVLQDLVFYP